MTEVSDELNPFKISRISSALGLTSARNLYWFYKQADGLNFGDWVGPYLYKAKTGLDPYYFNPRRRTLGTYFAGCGSILGHIRHPGTAIVWGSGAIKPEVRFAKPKRIHAVRGPLTRYICNKYDYECPEIYGDPAILLPKYYNPKFFTKKYPLGIVPHFKDLQLANGLFRNRDDVLIIDVKRTLTDVIDDILSCEAVVSTSLHGVIVAQAYGIPAAWAIISDEIIGGKFKFEDYFLGVGFSQPQDPILIDHSKPQSTKELVISAHSTAALDNSKIAERLLEACPF